MIATEVSKWVLMEVVKPFLLLNMYKEDCIVVLERRARVIARTGGMIGMAVTTGIVVMIDAVETVGTIVAVEIADQTEKSAMSDI